MTYISVILHILNGWINVTPGILVPCDPIIDVKIYLCWSDLYFMVDFSLYLEYYLLDKCHTWDVLVTRLLTSKYISVGVILWFSDFALYLECICWINVTPGILLPCDPMNDHLQAISRSL